MTVKAQLLTTIFGSILRHLLPSDQKLCIFGLESIIYCYISAALTAGTPPGGGALTARTPPCGGVLTAGTPPGGDGAFHIIIRGSCSQASRFKNRKYLNFND